MKLWMPYPDQTKIGGGWSFSEVFFKYNEIHPIENADTVFIPGATLVDKHVIREAKEQGKRIVLRVDNHLLPSRNRNSGMQRLIEFAGMADLIIYQSKWAKDYLAPIIQPPGAKSAIILNGIDLSLFYENESVQSKKSFLYARSSRINEKGWDMARYYFSRVAMEEPDAKLFVVGKFSGENHAANFDFFNNEDYRFYGELDRKTFAGLLRTSEYFLYSYFMDACSNTLIEALCSGCKIIDIYRMLKTGGAPEIMRAWQEKGRDYFGYKRMIEEYRKVM